MHNHKFELVNWIVIQRDQTQYESDRQTNCLSIRHCVNLLIQELDQTNVPEASQKQTQGTVDWGEYNHQIERNVGVKGIHWEIGNETEERFFWGSWVQIKIQLFLIKKINFGD